MILNIHLSLESPWICSYLLLILIIYLVHFLQPVSGCGVFFLFVLVLSVLILFNSIFQIFQKFLTVVLFSCLPVLHGFLLQEQSFPPVGIRKSGWKGDMVLLFRLRVLCLGLAQNPKD